MVLDVPYAVASTVYVVSLQSERSTRAGVETLLVRCFMLKQAQSFHQALFDRTFTPKQNKALTGLVRSAVKKSRDSAQQKTTATNGNTPKDL